LEKETGESILITDKNEKERDFRGQVKAGSGKSNMKGVRV
jgi:hypothetical protein